MDMEKTIIKPSEKEVRRAAGLWNLQEIARDIGVKYHLLRYHAEQGRLPDPQFRFGVGERRYYDDADVQRIAEFFKTRSLWERQIK
jgi:hypothetical protein